MHDLSINLHSFPYLKNRKVAFCIGGSIAAVESVKVIREFRRWGAEVTVFASKDALKFIGKSALEWASTNQCYFQFDNFANHIFSYDFAIVFSASANLISQIANGISGTLVTNLIASAMGQNNGNGKPIFFCPTMHDSLYNNPFFKRNLEKLQKQKNIFFIDGIHEEGKNKAPSKEIICAQVIRTLHQKKIIVETSLAEKKILLTGGCIPTYVDTIRILISHFSGRTSIEIAKHLFYRGADFDFIFSKQNYNSILKEEKFLLSNLTLAKDYDEYSNTCLSFVEKKYKNEEFIISVAAVADYKSEFFNGKITSQKINQLKLSPTQKVIEEMRKRNSTAKMLVFKYEENDLNLLQKNAIKKINSGFDFVIGNLKKKEQNPRAFFFSKNQKLQELKTEMDLIDKILAVLN